MEITLEGIKNLSKTYIFVNVISHYCVSVFCSFPHFLYFESWEEIKAQTQHSIALSPFYWILVFFATYFAWNVLYNLNKTIYNSKFSRFNFDHSAHLAAPSRQHEEPEVVVVTPHLRSRPRQRTSTLWCDVCRIDKPTVRTHHCKICRACILRRDHHCYVLGECVGLGNQGHFILFLLHAAISLCFSSAFFILYVNHNYLLGLSFKEIVVGQFYLFPLNAFRWLFWRDFNFTLIFVSLFLAVSSLNALVCGAYGLFQLTLILRDETSYEFWKDKKLSWFSFGGSKSKKGRVDLVESCVSLTPDAMETKRTSWSRSLVSTFGSRWMLVPFLPCLLVPSKVTQSRVKDV